MQLRMTTTYLIIVVGWSISICQVPGGRGGPPSAAPPLPVAPAAQPSSGSPPPYTPAHPQTPGSRGGTPSKSNAASERFMGTWKLNEAKSKLGPDAAKNITVVYAISGDRIKVAVNGVDRAGKPVHNEWSGKFDGKDYAVTGDPDFDARTYKQTNDHTLEMTNKEGGKVTSTGHISISADGKSRTVTIIGTTANGVKTVTTRTYDKQ